MKTVGKQLQEARLAKNWTPELAARETKIKVDRLHDLETDDYSHFSSPTYARGFVRTYARALGLDEYKVLRQLDNKLPDDDSANIVTDGGVAYLPETAMPPRAAHRDYTGLYIVMGLGAVITLAIVFVLFEAYRVGELSHWFGSSQETVVAETTSGTNTAPANLAAEPVARALPVDSNTPPPIADTTTATNAPAAVADTTPSTASDTNAASAASSASSASSASTASTASATGTPGLVAPRALPVDPSQLVASADTNAAPVQAVRALPVALPVDPSELTNAAPATPGPSPAASSDTASSPPAQTAPMVAPRALPVDPSELTNAASATPDSTTLVAANTPSTPPVAPPVPVPDTPAPSTARQSNSGPVMEPSMPAVEPSADTVPVAPPATPNAAPQASTTPDASADTDKRLVLTASQDSFVRVTDLDAPDADKPLYAAVLHSGQSVGFDGHKFSINVGVPSAVDIKLDGVNYGPHSDQDAPETFVVQSHLP